MAQNNTTNTIGTNNKKEVPVKHIHNQVKGKEALELFAEVRFLNSACCQARYNYLKTQALSYVKWVSTQEWCTDATEYARKVVADIEKLLTKDPQGDEVSDIQIDVNAQMQNRIGQLDAEEDMAASLEQLMESNVAKAYRKVYGIEGNLRFWEAHFDRATARLEKLVKELKTQDTIQDYLDSAIEKKNKKMLVKAKGRLQDLIAKNEIEWETYSIFFNQIQGMLQWVDGTIRRNVKEGSVNLVPDRIRYFENRIVQYKAKMEEAHRAIFNKDEEPEQTNEQFFQEVVAEGFQLAKNDLFGFQQVVEFVHNHQR